jgi:molybdopterin/thiamine biosynthesis adenylyltransferase
MSYTSARLAKQENLFGRAGMEAIAETRLCVIGCGRNGRSVVMLAAYAGFMKFCLVDPDVVKTHNVNATVPFFRADVGRPKVGVLKERLESLDPAIECETHKEKVGKAPAGDALERADVIVDATDSIETKLNLNGFAARLHEKGRGTKLLSLGSGAFVREGRILQLGAQATLFEKGGACLLCGSLDEAGYSNLSGVSLVMVNVFASLLGLNLLLSALIDPAGQAGERSNFILFDCLKQESVSLKRSPRPDCAYCGAWKGKVEA